MRFVDESGRFVWDRRPKSEPTECYRWFLLFRDLGESRDIRDVRQAIIDRGASFRPPSDHRIRQVAFTHEWEDRVLAYDLFIRERAAKDAVERFCRFREQVIEKAHPIAVELRDELLRRVQENPADFSTAQLCQILSDTEGLVLRLMREVGIDHYDEVEVLTSEQSYKDDQLPGSLAERMARTPELSANGSN